MTTPRSAAQTAIAQAELSATTERNAMRLLAQANDQNGHVLADWSTLCDLFEVGNSAVVRRHLGMMQTAKIIHYSTNQYVYINFHAWTARVGDTETVIPDHSKRAPTRANDPAPTENAAPQNPTDALQSAPDLLNARVGTTESARGDYSGGDNRGGRLVGINSFPIPGENLLPTNPPVSADPLEKWEAAASEGLLLSLGCEKLTAVRSVAQSVPFQAIRAHALAWQRDTKSTGPGGLLYRIRSGTFAVPEITASDRESSLFLRWRTPSELAEDARRQAEIAENDRRIDQERAERDARRLAQAQQAPASPSASTDSPPPIDQERAERDARRLAQSQQAPASPSPSTDSPPPVGQGDEARLAKARELWQMANSELALSLPTPTFEQWVRDTDVLSYTDGEFAIGVPHAYARDWLQNRLRPATAHHSSSNAKW